MRITIVIAIFLFLSIGAIPTLAQRQEFSPEDRSFTITMPGTPKCDSERIKMFGETIKINMCVHADEPAQRFYSVTYLDRPQSSFEFDDKTALKSGYLGALAMSNSRIVSEREVTVDGFLGIEAVWRANDINMSSTKLFILTEQRMVIADISGQPEAIPENLIRAFLDTLRFTVKAPAGSNR
jgi:hypothetical protein